MLSHLALEADWAAAQATGSYGWSTRGLTIEQVGFLHACDTADQVRGVFQRWYADLPTPALLLTIDEARLPAYGLVVRREPGVPADPVGTLFPHVYGGPLPVDVVVGVAPYRA